MTIRNRNVKNSILPKGGLVFRSLSLAKPSKIVSACYNGVRNARKIRDQHHRKKDFFMAQNPNSKGHEPKNHRVPEMQMAIASFFLKGGCIICISDPPLLNSLQVHRQQYLIGFNACTDSSQIQLPKRHLTFSKGRKT